MNIQNQPKGSRERTLDEVKAEFMKRAGKLNPFEDIKREDAERVMAALKSLDKDHWAEEWSKIGLGYEAQGDERARAAGATLRCSATPSPSLSRNSVMRLALAPSARARRIVACIARWNTLRGLTVIWFDSATSTSPLGSTSIQRG